ncbi:MAG TPA: triphosphoribosyl-dephospho-CoA synthase [Ruminiclostridium sp.]
MWKNGEHCSGLLGQFAVDALIEEARLTPKPALVDMNNSGAHTDINIDLMLRSAQSLQSMFVEIGRVAFKQKPSWDLKEEIAVIGRRGEATMLKETGGTNTHRGAIWSLGLLTAGAAMNEQGTSAHTIAAAASALACYFIPSEVDKVSNGYRAKQNYGVQGARGEAQDGFPHVTHIALPALYKSRESGIPESFARVDALIALIASLDDTCILHRGGMEALMAAKNGARAVLGAGGISTLKGWREFQKLDEGLIARNASPGGSADLLAAALFLDNVSAEANTGYKFVN